MKFGNAQNKKEIEKRSANLQIFYLDLTFMNIVKHSYIPSERRWGVRMKTKQVPHNPHLVPAFRFIPFNIPSMAQETKINRRG